MNSCPKCAAGWSRISGPRYEKDYFGRERLRYTCVRCGYSTTTQPADAEKRKENYELEGGGSEGDKP